MSTFVFPGQGSQHKEMGKDLFGRYPDLVAIANRVLGYSLTELCLDDPKGQLNETQFTQTALYVVNALTWFHARDANRPRPDYLAGHSLGEYNALLAAEAIDFETGLRLVQKRGELMGKVKGGGMAAIIGLPDHTIERILAENAFTGVDIANRNTPSQFVIGGPLGEMERAKGVFEAAGARLFVPLRVSAPFHSRHMGNARREFAEFLSTVEISRPKVPVISNVMARPYAEDRMKELLAEQMTSPVRWTETIQYLRALGETEFVELGPGTVLSGLIKKIQQEAQPLPLPVEEPPLRTAEEPGSFAGQTNDESHPITVDSLAKPEAAAEHPAYKRDGVYVVIGGAGGIGRVWSEYVIRHYAAQTLWIGRRALDEEIQSHIDRLGQIGPRPLYLSADATDRTALQSAYDEIKRRFPRINGLVHAAIILQDQSLANMDEDVFRAALSAKVDVSVRMAQVFAPEPLDFVLFFSSINTFGKRAGQSNYAAGCTFKDAFAQKLSANWPCVVKVMNWGYWGNVGVTASDAYRQRMAKLGIGSIESEDGMQALEMLFNSPVSQLAMVKVTKPLALDGMSLSESLDLSTQKAPSVIDVLIRELETQDRLNSAGLSSDLLRQRRRVEAVLHRLLWALLQEMVRRDKKSSADWTVKLGITSAYRAWLEESIDALCRVGLMRRGENGIEAAGDDSLTAESAWQEWEDLKNALVEKDIRAQLTLAETTLRALPDILAGRRRATDVMFLNSSMELVGAIYKANRVADYFNEALADVVRTYCEARIDQDLSMRIRILEVGAGTGGTTETVLKCLAPFAKHIDDYCYTDISKAFLLHGERTYGPANPFMSFRIFNVESEPDAQDLQPASYDLVIAANVLHATARIRQTLRHTKALLRKNGLLLLNELSEKTLFSHVTFGLLQGWWLYKDPALRIKGTPALSPATWKRVLKEEGFPSIAFTASEAHNFGQQIIVAESDGRIRRRLNPAPNPTPLGASAGATGKASLPASKSLNLGRPQFVAPQEPAGNSLRERARSYFKKLVGETLKIPSPKIASSEPLERYGIDSINIVELTNVLRKDLGEVDSTLFFEYQTIDAVVEHFLAARRNDLIALLGDEQPIPATETSSPKDLIAATSPAFRFRSIKSIPGTHLESRMRAPHSIDPLSPIAVIGIAGRYPNAENLSEFWDVLQKGQNCITEIPRDRWRWEAYFGTERGQWGSIYTKWGGFLKDIDKFDPLFFHISPLEAKRMDPQERLFLETAYASVEDAGYTPDRLCNSRKVGVFVGVMNSTYRSQPAHWSIANRVSYTLDFQGPSMAVDTACSASLTAIHLAVESIRAGTSECAIAGGVNLIVDPVHYFGLSLAGMLTPSDQCKPFGDGADGLVDGEGVGAIVLKPLQRAIADGDHIYGVIKGTAINSSGRTNGYTVPNPAAQCQLITDALRNAGVNPRTVSYIEAQATGTILGDPIEIAGLKRAFEQHTDEKGFCAIGSVKSNIGHCESAAGIAGVTKVLLQLQHGRLAPSIHSETLNPNIRFEETPFTVQQQLAEWKRPTLTLNGESRQHPRIAGVSSFGAGGANAHVIIEEFERDPATLQHSGVLGDDSVLILLSAKNPEALKRVVRRLSDFLKNARQQNSPPSLADLAFTLQVGRVAMEERLAIMVCSTVELEEKLERLTGGDVAVEGAYRGRAKSHGEALSIFDGDDDMDEAIGKWLQRRKLSKLMELWLLGRDIDWTKLYAGQTPRRLALPTYPFERERHWLAESDRKEQGTPPSPDLTSATSLETPPLKVSVEDDLERDLRQPSNGQPPVATHQSLEDYVRTTIANELCEALEIGDRRIIDFDDSFSDFGLDSMTGAQVVRRISETLKIELNVTRLFDYTSVNKLASHIVSEYSDALSAALPHPRADKGGSNNGSFLLSSSHSQRSSENPFAGRGGTEQQRSHRGMRGSPDNADLHLEASALARDEEQESGLPDTRSIHSPEFRQKEPIAIIGMSGQFAKSKSVDALWSNLAAGRDLIDEVTRWDLATHRDSESLKKDGRCRYGGLLEDIDQFDPMFFNISAIEATYMDPQQRLFLQEAWRAMEDAGYAGHGTDGLSCGVYVGCGTGDYFNLCEATAPAQVFWGNAPSITPARIAYYMNLQGPAIAIDTACSSSLVAIHLACQGLWTGETQMALAGGVFVQSTPALYLLSARAGMLSPSGRCHTFDRAADGFVMGEGVGVLVLKRLNDAIADGDHIYGVIRGSGINQDGRTNGITAPNSQSQERLEREVYESFQIHPEDIEMVEAHGTGTKLGDPIEFEALTRAFRKDTDKRQYCAIGSIKTNLGHATMAAGVAGVMRVLLSLQHKQIPPSLNFANANENIRFEESPFYVNTHLKDWDVPPGKKRCAAVSSFGFSGTNAHMVLEEAPAVERQHEPRPAYLIVLSARTAQQLQKQADQLRDFCGANSHIDCGNMSYTLLLGRKHLAHRLTVIVRDVEDLAAALKEWSATGNSSRIQVADISHRDRHEPIPLKRYGNDCIGKAHDAQDPSEVREHLAVIAELYLQGYKLDYRNLFASGGYSRMALPTYPFSGERYWVPQSTASGDPVPGEAVPSAIGTVDESVSHSVGRQQRAIPTISLNPNSGVASKIATAPEHEPLVGPVTLRPVWDPVVLDAKTLPAFSTKEPVAVIGAADDTQCEIRSVFPEASFLPVRPGDPVEQLRRLLEDHSPISHLVWIAPQYDDASIFDDAIVEQQDQSVFAGFRLIKALLALGYGNRDLTWTVMTCNSQPVLPENDLNPAHAGLHGLVGSMAQEYPNWHIRLVDLGENENWPVEDLFRLPSDPRGAAWAYRGQQWYRRHLLSCSDLRERSFSYRDGGVYVVIGGAGGIGAIWSEFVIRQHNARVIWIGRRPQDADISRKLDRLSELGQRPLYVSADASNSDDLTRAYEEIKKGHSLINGVILSTVGVLDQSLAEMTEERFEQGLSAKVDISVRIAQTFRTEPLDFILCFSSIESFATSHGKASYTSGCAFMDAYAYQLSRELSSPVKVMNWGYWGDVGASAGIPAAVKHRMARSGIGSINPEEGMNALSALLAGPWDQLVFVKTTKPLSIELLGSPDSVVIGPTGDVVRVKPGSKAEANSTASADRPTHDRHLDTIAGKLRSIISRVTQVGVDKLEMRLTWTELGLDSILSMQVIQEIESEFGLRIYPTELIEHDSPETLLSFLAAELPNMRATTGPQAGTAAASGVAVAVPRVLSPQGERTDLRQSQGPVVFILSTPRAGSTLLRVMMAGHPQLFSPPELHLLPFSDFGERAVFLKANQQQFLEEGVIKALCELKGIAVGEAKAITSTWASENTPIREVYRELQALCPTKLLVDKSPSYATDVAILRKAESLGTEPFYIHLVRHPLAVMESFVRNRFDKLLSIKEDPWTFAAQLWHRYNANIDTFLSEVPSERWIRIRYEDLVAQPLPVTRELFRHLHLNFDSRVLDPYEGDRMTGGLYEVSLPLADPNFNHHTKIEADLGIAWEKHLDKVSLLDDPTVRMAERYGYRLVKNQRHTLLPAQEAFLRRFGASPVWTIDQFLKLKLDRALDVHRLRACLQHVTAKHASLRNVFRFENGTWFQEEGDTYSVPVFQVDGRGIERREHHGQALISALQDELHQCVDGTTRVNLACGVLDLGNHEYEIILVVHHLAADGMSVLKLQRDVLESYRSSESLLSNPLPDDRMYAYLRELERLVTPGALREHKRFWQADLDSVRYRIPIGISPQTESCGHVAAESEYTLRLPTGALGWPAGRSKKDFFPYLAGALYQCLSAGTGLSQVVVAHRIHRRNIGADQDFGDVVGWFAGDVPVKVTVNPDHSLDETAAAFHERFKSLPMGGVTYEMLANTGEVPHCHEVCPIRLNYYPASLAWDDVDVDFKKFEDPSHERLYVLDLIVSPDKGDCLFIVRYSSACFAEVEIKQLVESWIDAFQNNEAALIKNVATSGRMES